ncbi:MAG: hypothetical protein IPK28_06540 [Devosia sp.]|nr:hypothetical protein [Devosia sp.]
MQAGFLKSSLLALLLMTSTTAFAEEATPVEALGRPEAIATLAAACAESPTLKAMFDATEGDGTLARTEVCACLVEDLGPQITLADAEMLARQLQGTLSLDEREAYANTAHLGEITETSFSRCQGQTGHFTTD